MNVGVVILAAGSGRRFKPSKNPSASSSSGKVFYPLGGKPMLAYSLETFSRIPQIKETVLVVPASQVSWVKRTFLKPLPSAKPVRVVAGGKERSDSSLKGFSALGRRVSHVLIHDGARPLVSERAVKKLIQSLGACDGAILARKVVPTIKKVGALGDEIENTVPREMLWEAETPQFFKKTALTEAFRRYRRDPVSVSDDAGLVEQNDGRVRVVENPDPNLKITTAADIHTAERILGARNGALKTWGTGYDIHHLVKKRKLMVGGVLIPSPVGSLGHSDGDALLHAICDALLGAAGLGDIGEHFPDTNPKYRNVPSAIFMKDLRKELDRRRLMPLHVDATVHLERPKLLPFKNRIRKNVARLLKMKPEHVNIKAKTGEGLGAIGKGRAIAADAIAAVGYAP